MKDTVNWVNVLDKIIYNYNNTENRGCYDLTPKEASKPLAMNYIISLKRDITDSIKNKEQIINVGDYCRIKNNKKLFDKLQTNYSKEIYLINEVNKNTVKLDNGKLIKKSNILIINEKLLSSNKLDNNYKKDIEKDYAINKKLKKLDVDKSNIIENKRERKVKQSPDYYY